MQQCTAVIRDGWSDRCIREIGHPGLHRVENTLYIYEFSNEQAYFPLTTKRQINETNPERNTINEVGKA